MRILLLTSSMSAGGAERVASTLVNAWSTRGDRVALMPTFSGGGESFYPVSSDALVVSLARLAGSTSRSMVSRLVRLRAMRRFILEWKPDVVVSFLANVNIAAVLASVRLPIPVVVCERSNPFARPAPLLLRAGSRVTYPFADALVVQTADLAKRYETSRWPWGRVRVIPNPAPADLLDLRHTGRTDGRHLLLAMGRLSPEKQFDRLLRVFAGLPGRHPSWVLRIVGDGPLRPALEQQVEALGLRDRVELPGWTRHPEHDLAAADAYVLTSRYEGFPNGLLEAMTAGVPCVTFDCPSGPREMTRDGAVALLIPPDDGSLDQALSTLMSDEELRSSVGQRARASVIERYSLAHVLELWDDLFAEVA
jgi:glycosyltransferase involved in cell wall biosynthesis